MDRMSLYIGIAVGVCIAAIIALLFQEVEQSMHAFEVGCHQYGGNITLKGEVFLCELDNGTTLDYPEVV